MVFGGIWWYLLPGLAFLRGDERLDEILCCLYLEVGEALGVAHVVVVALTRTDFAETVGYACEIRLRDEALLRCAVNCQGSLLALALFFILKFVKSLTYLT